MLLIKYMMIGLTLGSFCVDIAFSPRPQPFNYFVSDFNLHMASTARDLGVLVDRRLTFRDHVK